MEVKNNVLLLPFHFPVKHCSFHQHLGEQLMDGKHSHSCFSKLHIPKSSDVQILLGVQHLGACDAWNGIRNDIEIICRSHTLILV